MVKGKKLEKKQRKSSPYDLRPRKENCQATRDTTSGATSAEPEIHTLHGASPARNINSDLNMAPPKDSNVDTVSRSEFQHTMDKVMEKLDSLNVNVQKMHDQFAEIKQKLSDLQTAAEDSANRLTTIENETLPQMKKRNDTSTRELKNMIIALEIHDRKANLLFYGVEQKKDENILQIVKEKIEEVGFPKRDTENMPISNAHRLPRRVTPGDNRPNSPNPIIVRFGAMLDRDRVLQQYQRKQWGDRTGGNQAQTKHQFQFRIVTDLPPALKQKRFQLEQRAYYMRKNENKQTRIRLVGTGLQLQHRERGSPAAAAWTVIIE